MRSPGSSCRASSAIKVVTSYPCMGLFPKREMVEGCSSENNLGEVREGLAQLAAYHHRPGHQLPTFYEGLRLIGENAKGPVRMQLIWGRPPALSLSASAHSRSPTRGGALGLLSVSSIRPPERPNWYLRSRDFGFEVGEPLGGFWRR